MGQSIIGQPPQPTISRMLSGRSIAGFFMKTHSLQEKGGKVHQAPAHHRLVEYLLTGRPEARDSHHPTGAIPVGTFPRFLIQDLPVTPERHDWPSILVEDQPPLLTSPRPAISHHDIVTYFVGRCRDRLLSGALSVPSPRSVRQPRRRLGGLSPPWSVE